VPVLKQTALIIVFLISSLQSYAGPSISGGGDVVILPDDSIVLADPFLDMDAQQPNNIIPQRTINPRLIKVIEAYHKVSQDVVGFLSRKENSSYSFFDVLVGLVPGESDINLELEKLITRKNDLRFFAVRNVTELRQYCATGGKKKYVIPTGASVEQVACTAGNETFIVEPTFQKLSLKDQALLLIHERLTTLRDVNGGKNYAAIARFTTGLSVYLSLYKEQSKKIFRKLSANEQKQLSEFYIGIEEVELRNSEIHQDSFQWSAAQSGGGLVHAESNVDSSATIGLSFIIGRNATVGPRAELKNQNNRSFSHIQNGLIGEATVIEDSVIIGEMKIGSGTKITNSFIRQSDIGSNSTIIKANLMSVEVLENSRIIESGVWFLTAGRDTHIEQSTVDTETNAGDYLTLVNSKISVKKEDPQNRSNTLKHRVTIGSNQRLENSFISYDSYDTYPVGTKLDSKSYTWSESFHYAEGSTSSLESLKRFYVYDKDGLSLLVKTDAVAKRRGIFDSTEDTFITQGQFSINFNPPNNNYRSGGHTIYKGKIRPAGPKMFFEVTATNGAGIRAMWLIEAKLTNLGFSLIEKRYENESYNYRKFQIPFVDAPAVD